MKMQTVVEAIIANHAMTEKFWKAVETHIETFVGIWARNIKAQGFCEVKPEMPAVS